MTTTYRVTLSGKTIGIFPADTLTEVRDLVRANPGAEVEVKVTVNAPCTAHASYEAENCPPCGSARFSA